MAGLKTFQDITVEKEEKEEEELLAFVGGGAVLSYRRTALSLRGTRKVLPYMEQ